MPTIPPVTKCSMLGCRNERTRYSANCIEHGGKQVPFTSEERKQAGKNYHTSFWKGTRSTQLSMHPLCAGCLAEGKIEQAVVVDHVFPWRQINEHAFHHNLFQSLCYAHHTHKTSLEYKGIYRRYGTPTRDYVKEDYPKIVKAD